MDATTREWLLKLAAGNSMLQSTWNRIAGDGDVHFATDGSMVYGSNNLVDMVNSGDMTPNEAMAYAGNNGVEFNPEQESFLNRTQDELDRTHAEERTDYKDTTDILNDAEQLRKLGLSNAGVYDVGSSYGNKAEVGTVGKISDNAQMRYERNLSMAKSMISLVGSLGGAGIHGAAFMAAKNAAANASLAAARFVGRRR